MLGRRHDAPCGKGPWPSLCYLPLTLPSPPFPPPACNFLPLALPLLLSRPHLSLSLPSRQEHKYFEESFKVFERGVAIFKYPHVREIWSTYIHKFVQRYGGKKLERARDLFEQALENVSRAFEVASSESA